MVVQIGPDRVAPMSREVNSVHEGNQFVNLYQWIIRKTYFYGCIDEERIIRQVEKASWIGHELFVSQWAVWQWI